MLQLTKYYYNFAIKHMSTSYNIIIIIIIKQKQKNNNG